MCNKGEFVKFFCSFNITIKRLCKVQKKFMILSNSKYWINALLQLWITLVEYFVDKVCPVATRCFGNLDLLRFLFYESGYVFLTYGLKFHLVWQIYKPDATGNIYWNSSFIFVDSVLSTTYYMLLEIVTDLNVAMTL